MKNEGGMKSVIEGWLSSYHGANAKAWITPLAKAMSCSGSLCEMLDTPASTKQLIPSKDLIFRALLANEPVAYNVVVFGQNPYPRKDSATGIALLDGRVKSWNESLPPTLSQILKAAYHSRNEPCDNSILELAAIRDHAQSDSLVQPCEWFEATLHQGCLWLNCALTQGGPYTVAQHIKMWKTVIKAILRTIMAHKQKAVKEKKGCVFALWGTWATSLEPIIRDAVKGLDVHYRISYGPNPASRGNSFAESNPLRRINDCLVELGMFPVNWWPCDRWRMSVQKNTLDLPDLAYTGSQSQSKRSASEINSEEVPSTTPQLLRMDESNDDGLDKKRMKLNSLTQEKPNQIRLSHFVAETLYLHSKSFKEVLEASTNLKSVTSLNLEYYLANTKELPSLQEALSEAGEGFVEYQSEVTDFCGRVRNEVWAASLTSSQVGALHLYTLLHSPAYRIINTVLRNKNRDLLRPFVPFLRLLVTALSRLRQSQSVHSNSSSLTPQRHLWRGIALPAEKLDAFSNIPSGSFHVPPGTRIVWWAMTSCSVSKDVAIDFLLGQEREGAEERASSGKVLFHVAALRGVPIQKFSAYGDQEEVLLPPGSQLVVSRVTNEGEVTIIHVFERWDLAPLVS